MWANSEIFIDSRPRVSILRAEPDRDILVLNSASVIQSLVVEALVNDLRLLVLLVLLGSGLRRSRPRTSE